MNPQSFSHTDLYTAIAAEMTRNSNEKFRLRSSDAVITFYRNSLSLNLGRLFA